jgi:hypothetical protein
MKKALYGFWIILLALPVAVYCEELPPPEIKIPSDASWYVAFATFEGKNLSGENDYLVKSIPFLLKGELESIKTHYFDETSKTAYRKALVFDKLKEQYLLLKQSQKTRDDLLFENLQIDEREKRIKVIDETIAKATTLIAQYNKYDASQIVYPDTMPVQIKTTDKDDVLLAIPKYSALQYAIDKKINLLVWGSVEEIQGYIVVDIKVLDVVMQTDVYSYNTVMSPDDLASVIEETKGGIAGAILGTDWGTIAVTLDPPKGILFMNGEFMGIGNTRIAYVPVGDKKINAEAPGYNPQQINTSVASHKETTLDIKLVKKDLAKLYVVSDPTGADVYVNSEWVGKTPLYIEKTKEMKRTLLTMKEYDDYSFHVDETSGEESVITLARHTIDFNARQSEARDNFYTSFGFFLVSIALPIFISGYVQDYDFIIPSKVSLSPPFDNYMTYKNVLSGSYWGALTITGVLGITTIVNLIQYIIASDRPFG